MSFTWAACTTSSKFRASALDVTRVWGLLLIVLLCSVVIRGQLRLADRLDPALDGVELSVNGTVVSLPAKKGDYLEFEFRPTGPHRRLLGLPKSLDVRWYRQDPQGKFPQVMPGQQWKLQLRLRSPRSLVNFQGFDRERTWFADGTGGLATVLGGQVQGFARSPLVWLNTWRYRVRETIKLVLSPGQGRALVRSLAIADRSELSPELWRLLRETGTGHLLAISGLHIGLAAAAGFWLTRTLMWLVPGRPGHSRRTLLISCAGSLLAAGVYGALAAYPVSTLRALSMLGLGLYAWVNRQAQSPFLVLALAAVLVVAFDPVAPIRPGFWLSFGAVLALISMFAPRTTLVGFIRKVLLAQAAVIVLMLPLAAFWFQRGSWLAFPANILAIPWVSLVTVPLVLAGVGLAGASPADHLLSLAALSAEWLVKYLTALRDLAHGGDWPSPSQNVAMLASGLAGGSLLLLPRGLAARWMGVCLLALCFLPKASELQHGGFQVEVLDVGQGLAVAVRTRSHALLYDTGPGDGQNWSLADRVLVPAMQSGGLEPPDRILVSHADMDHAGGLADVRTRFPRSTVWINREEGGVTRTACEAGKAWRWDGVDFRVLHPTIWLPYQGNDSSCVLAIDNDRHRVLLTGDITSTVEARLIDRLGQADLITVPHHGSNSSSSDTFIKVVRPGLAVVSASHGNRFGFPRPDVLQRYRAHDAKIVSTAECGAIRATFTRDQGASFLSARRKRSTPWRWPGSSDCP